MQNQPDLKRFIVFNCPSVASDLGKVHVHMAGLVDIAATFEHFEEVDKFIIQNGGRYAIYSTAQDVYVQLGGGFSGLQR